MCSYGGGGSSQYIPVDPLDIVKAPALYAASRSCKEYGGGNPYRVRSVE